MYKKIKNETKNVSNSCTAELLFIKGDISLFKYILLNSLICLFLSLIVVGCVYLFICIILSTHNIVVLMSISRKENTHNFINSQRSFHPLQNNNKSEIYINRLIYDFNKSYIGIVDDLEQRCYILSLPYRNRKPANNFSDLLNKLRNKYYNIEKEDILKNYKVIHPLQITENTHGKIISGKCRDYKNYLLI